MTYPDKAELQDRRNEKLARKNPDRLQKQIDDLKAITEKGGKLTRHEQQVLEGLEREHKAVTKAREALGDKAPSLHRGWTGDREGGGGDYSRHGGAGVLGKRRRPGSQGGAESSEEEDVPEDVKSIPMPRDTPPPIPKEVLDEWYAKRRARRNAEQGYRYGGPGRGDERESAENTKEARAAPVVESKTVYEAAPVTRNLQQEAVSAFVPSAVRTKVNKGAGQGGLMEPEEADRLEKEGYLKRMEDRLRSNEAEAGAEAGAEVPTLRKVTVEDAEDDDD